MLRLIKFLFLGMLILMPTWALAITKGLYLTEYSAIITKKVEYFVKQAKELGIDTFVVDTEFKNTRFEKNIAYIKSQGIRYVARITVFPDGGTPAQIKSRAYWEQRWKEVQYALSLGASEIQLDYIRYKASQKPSPQNAKDVLKVIQFFADRLQKVGVPLQLDVFGIATIKPSLWIGQNLPLFATAVGTLNPMVYPSHFEPFRVHAVTPYETVRDSIRDLKKQLSENERKTLKINAYIEQTNYRYPLSHAKRLVYFRAQMKGAIDGGANGWYVWSPNNKYDVLFQVLRESRQNGGVADNAPTAAESKLVNAKATAPVAKAKVKATPSEVASK